MFTGRGLESGGGGGGGRRGQGCNLGKEARVDIANANEEIVYKMSEVAPNMGGSCSQGITLIKLGLHSHTSALSSIITTIEVSHGNNRCKLFCVMPTKLGIGTAIEIEFTHFHSHRDSIFVP